MAPAGIFGSRAKGKSGSSGSADDGAVFTPKKPVGSASDDADVFDSPAGGNPKKSSSGGGRDGTTGSGIGAVLAQIAGLILTIFVALKLIPQAVADTLFGWLPEEMRAPASSSCCCSCCLISLLALLAVAVGYME